MRQKNHVRGCALGDHTGLCVVIDETLPFPTVIMSQGLISAMRDDPDPTLVQMKVALGLAPGNTHIYPEFRWVHIKSGVETEALSGAQDPKEWRRQSRVRGVVTTGWVDL